MDGWFPKNNKATDSIAEAFATQRPEVLRVVFSNSSMTNDKSAIKQGDREEEVFELYFESEVSGGDRLTAPQRKRNKNVRPFSWSHSGCVEMRKSNL